MKRGLYAITDTPLLAGRMLAAVEAALKGGAVVVQYRDKSNDTARRMEEALALRMLCLRYRGPRLIDDGIELCVAVGADGVHLGQQDDSLQLARKRLGSDAIIGVTCHDSLALAEAAVGAGASYIAFGAFYASSTKPTAKPAALSILSSARHLGCPVVAIGGINADNAAPLIAAGADCVAVISDLWSAADIAAQAQAISRLF